MNIMYTNDFRHVTVHIKNPATEDLGPAGGTIFLISKNLEHQEKNKKLADKAAKSSEPNPSCHLSFLWGLLFLSADDFSRGYLSAENMINASEIT